VLDGAALDAHADAIARDGYTIVEDAIDLDLVDALCADLSRLEATYSIVPADNSFEGSRTVRIYNLLALGKVYEAIPVHEHVLPVVERVLDPGCLVSSLSSITILPGESAQPIHADDQLIPLDKPHAPTVCNSMWALTDFTEANGATRVIPGSHVADHSPEYVTASSGDLASSVSTVSGRQNHPSTPYDSVPAEMAKGSVLVWHGSLWHGGGANTTDERRIGIAMNYCAGYIRQQENQQLGIPRDVAAGFSPRLRELCGYAIYRGLIGHIDKHDPVEMLGSPLVRDPMLWDGS
jgi:ectoine hydroxylase-related dioxygenase (phytanoyl-CoA dioxygenase family)